MEYFVGSSDARYALKKTEWVMFVILEQGGVFRSFCHLGGLKETNF